MTKPIYLDYNATTPHDPAVISAMRPFLEKEFGNPSSAHPYGHAAETAVERSRRQVAQVLDCLPQEITFTSGGTESNNYAIQGIAHARREKGRHIITSQIEHPAVLEVCRNLGSQGFEITYLLPNKKGIIRPADVQDAIRPDTILVSIMHANNEIGTIQPLREISRITRRHDIALHTDAAQSVGKVPVRVEELGVDLLTVAGHKIYAPKGVGALYIRSGVQLVKFIQGAGQEMGRRAGTENVLGIVGLGQACKIINDSLNDCGDHMRRMRDLLYEGLKKELPGILLNGHPVHRLPNTLSISFKNIAAHQILDIIDAKVAASAGSACHSDRVDVSHVLTAIKLPEARARGTLRFSTGRMTTAGEIKRTVRIIVDCISTMKNQNATGKNLQNSGSD